MKHSWILKLGSVLLRIPYLSFLLKTLYNWIKPDKTAFRKGSIITSRGCPNRCTFCAVKNVWGKTYRTKSVETIMKEIDYLVTKRGIREINITDDNYSVNKRTVIELSRRVREFDYPQLTFTANSGLYASSLDSEVLAALKEMGFKVVYLGIESGSQRVLDEVIKKKLDLKQVRKVIVNAKSIGLAVIGFFIVGIPGETLAEREETIDFILDSGLNGVRLYICQAFPGSELYNKAIKHDWLTPDYDLVNTLALTNACYFKTEDINPEEVIEFVKEARERLNRYDLLVDPIYT